MKYVKQLSLVIAVAFAGEFLRWLLPLPIPAGIYGMVLMFCLLEFKIVPLSAVKEVSAYLIEIMIVMFIPSAVGLMDVWDVIKGVWPVYILVAAVTTGLVMGVTGHVVQLLMKLRGKKS